jgi:glutathionylspermidine synthase
MQTSWKEFNENIILLEPPWKLIMSNKSLLALLWAMYPNHKYLIPTYFVLDSTNKKNYDNWISKKVFGREGISTVLGKFS